MGGQRTEPPHVEQLLHLQNCRASITKTREPPAARQSTQGRACKVEPMCGCGLWRTVQCCACSWSALHQLLHCSVALSCGFAALQLTVADLGEAAELRAWVPTSIASPQAARNVKAGGWNGRRRRLSLRHLGLAASQWRAACAARSAMAKTQLPEDAGYAVLHTLLPTLPSSLGKRHAIPRPGEARPRDARQT